MEDFLEKLSKGRVLKIQELVLRCRKASLHWAESLWRLWHAQKDIQGEREEMTEEGGGLQGISSTVKGIYLLKCMSPKYFDAECPH